MIQVSLHTHIYLWLMLFCSLFLSSDPGILTLDPKTENILIQSEENRNMTHVRTSRILIIQRDLMCILRFCVERV